jgi:hypothetical protein
MSNTSGIKEMIRNFDKNDATYRTAFNTNGENFFYYLNMLNLNDEDNTIILSSVHHYYYDFNELRKVKNIIQVKELNKVTDINKFLGNVKKVLSPTANFIGCFRDNKIYKDNVFKKIPIIDWAINKMALKTNHYLSRKRVLKLFDNHNFKIIDITELGNITYFHIKTNR